MRIDPKGWAYYALFPVIFFSTCSISLFEIASSILIGLCLIGWVIAREKGHFKNVFFGLCLIYFLTVLLSSFYSGYPDNSLRGVFKILRQLLLCFSAAYAVDTPKKFRNIFIFFLITAGVVCADALVQGISGKEWMRNRPMTPYGQTNRWTGPYRHANDFSAYLSFIFFLFAGVASNASKLWTRKGAGWVIAGLAVCLICLFGTYSRGAWAAVAVTWVVFGVLKRDRFLVGAAALAAVGFVMLAPAPMRDRAFSVFDMRNNTILERRALWSESIAMVRSSPWLGLGINTYSKNEPHFKTDPTVDSQYAHNGYLQMAAEIGILGVTAFLAAMLFWLLECSSALGASFDPFLRHAGTGLVAGVAAFLLHSATDTDLQSLLLVNLLWLALGVGWAARNLARNAGPA